MDIEIVLNSEPPLIHRMGLITKTPLLEIGEHYWELGKKPTTISVNEFKSLLRRYL